MGSIQVTRCTRNLDRNGDRVVNLGLSLACGLLTATGFGTADFMAKLSAGKMGFVRTALLVQVIGSFFVLPFALTDLSRLIADPAFALAAVLLGVVNAVGTLCLYKGFEVGRVSIVSPIGSTAPVVAIFLAVTFLGETVTVPRLAGISCVIVGIVLVSIQSDQKGSAGQVAKGTVYAIAFMLLSGVLLFGLKPVSTVLGVFLPVLTLRWVGSLVLVVPYLRQRKTDERVGSFRLILGVAFFDTFANVAYTLGVSLGTVTIVSTLGGLFSSITVLLAWVFLGERLSRHHIVGFIAILLGVAALGLVA